MPPQVIIGRLGDFPGNPPAKKTSRPHPRLPGTGGQETQSEASGHTVDKPASPEAPHGDVVPPLDSGQPQPLTLLWWCAHSQRATTSPGLALFKTKERIAHREGAKCLRIILKYKQASDNEEVIVLKVRQLSKLVQGLPIARPDPPLLGLFTRFHYLRYEGWKSRSPPRHSTEDNMRSLSPLRSVPQTDYGHTYPHSCQEGRPNLSRGVQRGSYASSSETWTSS
ncbi:LOW QUALITY PROTEIN: hypothetical protein Cgig2_007977 [Carnegiea gigantea]|uniref:Uncharacterized protein n=1 Tax=Carnegiea gigantea TaxID=171969 RepID=A0A9Q1GFQ1_9CARY|nr:LOW QUALITY PROTEIN: hypothetical protein Cgig2_007977 [Carnegiea gigantea]